MPQQNIEIIRYDNGVDSVDSLTSSIARAYETNQQFFGTDVARIGYHFLYSRDEMNIAYGQKTPDWLVGFLNTRDGNVYIFSPSVFDEASNHRHPKESFDPTLTHETTHNFINELFGFEYPVWLNEGIPMYVAGQGGREGKLMERGIQGFVELHDEEGWSNTHNYDQAYSFTNYLIITFGESAFFNFVSSLGKRDSFRTVSKKMKDSFGTTLRESKKDWIISLKDKYL